MNDIDRLQQTIAILEKQRAQMGDAAVDMAVSALKKLLEQQQQESLLTAVGERKLVTVMFADLSGFTTLSEREDPEVVHRLVNASFEQLAKVIMNYEGFIEKYIGDEIMAIFGAPVSYEDHAERALRSSLEMMKVLEDYNQRQGTELGLHIGINTGTVVTGIIGARQHQQYGVTGDTVNLAARLKQAATNGQVFVGPETYQLTHRSFDFEVLPPMDFKGKSNPITVYQLKAAKSEQLSRWVGKVSSPLVGRDKELSRLAACLRALAKGEGGRVSILGEAGIGKSRLIAEIAKQVDQSIDWIEGRALSYAQESSFLPIREIISKLIGAPPKEQGKSLRDRLSEALTELFGPAVAQHFLFLAHLMQVPLSKAESERINYFPAPVLAQKTQKAVAAFLNAKANLKPLVLVWEDLHWADPASLRLIEGLLAVLESAPILHLLIFRPTKEAPVWAVHERLQDHLPDAYLVLELDQLPASQSADLIQNLSGARQISKSILDLIHKRTEGNPFFVEELVRSLLDQGLLYLEQKELKASDRIDQVELPTTVQGVIASRIDRLDQDNKQVLQTAAVLGRIFHREVLGQLLANAGFTGQIDHCLVELMHRELLRERAVVEGQPPEFIFKHYYTYEVAYQSLLISLREQLHRLAAAIFEKQAVHASDDLAAIIGYHYERTPDKAKAVHYLQQAADRARRLHINDEAINLYRRAIDQLELLLQIEEVTNQRKAQYLDLLEILGEMQELNGQHKEAVVTLEKAMEVATGEEDLLILAHLIRKTGTSYNSSRQVQAALRLYDEADTLMANTGETDRSPAWWNEWIELQLDRLFLFYWIDKRSEMEKLLDELLPIIEQRGTPDQRARFFQSLVMFRFRKERLVISDESLDFARQMMAVTHEINNEKVVALSKFLYGFALLNHEDFQESISALEESVEAAKNLGDMINLVRSLNYLTMAYRRLGKVENVKEHNQQVLDIAHSLNLVEYLASGHAQQAWLAWQAGEVEAVIDFGTKALSFWQKLAEMLGSEVPISWMAYWPLIGAYRQQKRWPECIEVIERLMEPQQRPLQPELRALLEKIRSDQGAGRDTALAANIDKAIEMAQSLRLL